MVSPGAGVTRVQLLRSLVFPLLIAVAACESGGQGPGVDGDVIDDELAPLGGVTCASGAAACSNPAGNPVGVYSALHRVVASATSRSEVAQTFTGVTGSPGSVTLKLRLLRDLTATPSPHVRVAIREVTGGVVPTDDAVSLSIGSVPANGLPRGRATDVTIPLVGAHGPVNLEFAKSYALVVSVDVPSSSEVSVGVSSHPASTYSGGQALRRRTTGAFTTGGEDHDLSFSLSAAPTCAVDNGGCDELTTCTPNAGGRTCSACPANYVGTGETGCLWNLAELSGLTIAPGTFDATFATSVTTYAADVPLWAQSVLVTPTVPAGYIATVTVAGLPVASGSGIAAPLPLLGANVVPVVVTAESGVTRTYTLTIRRAAAAAYLKASNTGSPDQFGDAVAVDDTTLVVGAAGESSCATTVNGDGSNNACAGAGAVYVFVRSGGVWTQQAYLKASNSGAGDAFGASVGVSGDLVVVGARNEASCATTVNGNGADNACAAAGAAYVFARTGTTWTQQAYLKAANAAANDQFGTAVSINGTTIVATAPSEDSCAATVGGDAANNGCSDAGAGYVFERIGTTWTQQAYLKTTNTGGGDNLGLSARVHGDTVLLGATGEDSCATTIGGDGTNNACLSAGAAYVFARNGTTWTQQAYLKAANTGAGDQLGRAVGLFGDTAVVGAFGEDSCATGVNGNGADENCSDAGAAYVFARSGTTWTQQAYLKASNTGAGDTFGTAVDVYGTSVVVGARGEASCATGVGSDGSGEACAFAGAAYLFDRPASTWVAKTLVKATNTGANDYVGMSVALSSNVLVLGANGEDGCATGVNGNGADDACVNGGAAYTWLVCPDGSVALSGECRKRFTFRWVSAANQSFVVPAACPRIAVQAWGAGGGASQAGSWGGGGGVAQGSLDVTTGTTFTVVVGQGGRGTTTSTRGLGGWPNGGNGGNGGTSFQGGGGGGGYSGLFSSTPAQATALVLAGGGAGANSMQGGAGGGVTGVSGTIVGPCWNAATGGTSVTNGTGSTPKAGVVTASSGGAGAALTGGGGAAGTQWGGGGGGAGYWGGGGGGGDDGWNSCNYGGPGTGGTGGGGGSARLGASILGGSTTAGSGRNPGGWLEAAYPSGIALGGSNGANGGDGLLVITCAP